MKKINSTIVVFAFILLASGSCIKKIDQSPPNTNPAGKFSEINAPTTFSWSTTNKVSFNFKGTSASEYQLVLKVMNADGEILLQKLQKANEDYKVILEVPSYYKTLTVAYGSISEELDCTTGSVAITID